jgi:hypothetical protein
MSEPTARRDLYLRKLAAVCALIAFVLFTYFKPRLWDFGWLVGGVLLLLTVLASHWIRAFRCPACGGAFHAKGEWSQNPLARRCVHCGEAP